LEVAQAVVTAVAGVWLASAGLGGFFRGPLDLIGRGAFLIAGLALLIPAQGFDGAGWVELGGIVLAVAALLRQIMVARDQPA
jgi:TRAP-type uncharacterized transport system fused permease subunit